MPMLFSAFSVILLLRLEARLKLSIAAGNVSQVPAWPCPGCCNTRHCQGLALWRDQNLAPHQMGALAFAGWRRGLPRQDEKLGPQEVFIELGHGQGQIAVGLIFGKLPQTTRYDRLNSPCDTKKNQPGG